jgi:protein TonB
MIKNIFFLSLSVFFAIGANAQNDETAPLVVEAAYNMAGLQVQPEYPGGIEAFYSLIGSNFRAPEADVEEDTTIKIFVSFVIEKDGSLSNVMLLRNPGYGLKEEAGRVLALSEKWSPGMQDGKPVRTMYTLPISIRLEGTGATEEKKD